MSRLCCRACDSVFDASTTPTCPSCLADRWISYPTLVRDKHDHAKLPLAWDSYRSVLTPTFLEDRERFLVYAACHGRWYFDTHYQHFVHFTPQPLGRNPGVGIRAGRAEADHALDSLFVADADCDPHIFAADREQTEAQIRAGEFVPLASCRHEECSNLAVPGRGSCLEHAGPHADLRPLNPPS